MTNSHAAIGRAIHDKASQRTATVSVNISIFEGSMDPVRTRLEPSMERTMNKITKQLRR